MAAIDAKGKYLQVKTGFNKNEAIDPSQVNPEDLCFTKDKCIVFGNEVYADGNGSSNCSCEYCSEIYEKVDNILVLLNTQFNDKLINIENNIQLILDKLNSNPPIPPKPTPVGELSLNISPSLIDATLSTPVTITANLKNVTGTIMLDGKTSETGKLTFTENLQTSKTYTATAKVKDTLEVLGPISKTVDAVYPFYIGALTEEEFKDVNNIKKLKQPLNKSINGNYEINLNKTGNYVYVIYPESMGALKNIATPYSSILMNNIMFPVDKLSSITIHNQTYYVYKSNPFKAGETIMINIKN